MTAATLLLALAVLLVPTSTARDRADALFAVGGAAAPDRLQSAAPLLAAALLGAAVALGVGGVAGATAGLVLAGAARWGMRRLAAPRVHAVDPLAAAGTFDLLAACLASGLPVATAAKVVAPSAPAAVASVLRQAGDLLTLGAEPEAAWAAAAAEPATEALARLARRSARSGAALSAGVRELAEDRRAAATDAAAAAAERAGVLVAGPLGLCFLPAFLCLGVVPVVLGLAGPVLQGGVLG